MPLGYDDALAHSTAHEADEAGSSNGSAAAVLHLTSSYVSTGFDNAFDMGEPIGYVRSGVHARRVFVVTIAGVGTRAPRAHPVRFVQGTFGVRAIHRPVRVSTIAGREQLLQSASAGCGWAVRAADVGPQGPVEPVRAVHQPAVRGRGEQNVGAL
eukprot:1184606-Prorocentrum_minimum.AAC.2